MSRIFLAVFAVVVGLGLGAADAEAARIGGGKSVGMQRQAVSPKPASPTQQAAPATPAAPTAAPAATPKRNWLGPIAGLAAGLGIAALLSHFGLGEGMANFLMIALLVMAAVVVFRLLFRRPANAPNSSGAMQYAGAGSAGQAPVPPSGSEYLSGTGTSLDSSVTKIPEGFDVDGFLRVAKLNFVRLQASNDAGNLADIREFVTPELYAEISLQISERGKITQQTDVVTLNAQLLEVVTEGERHIASVHFNGMIRENAGAAAEAFDEVWNLSKSVDGRSGWVVAGIQQLN